MVSILVRHRVQDYERWRRIYDAAEPIRKAGGEMNPAVFQNEKDGNDVVVIGNWESENAARRFFNSEPLRAGKPGLGWWMQEAGVATKPEICVLADLGLVT